MNDYYKDLWTKPNQEGTKFFYNVDFNSHEYRLQEHIFRQFLKSLKRLVEQELDGSKVQPPIKNVLEVGAGTGRITKIMYEELGFIEHYCSVDINKQKEIEFKSTGIRTRKQLDITDYEEFDKWFQGSKFDLILFSEVLMHILPKDIDNVISRCSKLLNDDGLIINIDWASSHEPSEWCFIHPYDELYRKNGLQPVFIRDMVEIKQKIFCYGK